MPEVTEAELLNMNPEQLRREYKRRIALSRIIPMTMRSAIA